MRPWRSAGDRHGGYVCVKPGAMDVSGSTVAGKTGSYTGNACSTTSWIAAPPR